MDHHHCKSGTVSLILLLVVVSSGLILGAEERKNVLFFGVDDLRTELGAYGHDQVKSPNIDELAKRSLVFDRAYCQVAVCSPSRTSLLTGRRPDTNHVWMISPDEYWRTFTNATSLPQYFKENGYVSIGMGKIFHPGKPDGFDDKEYSWSPEGLPYFHGSNKVNPGHVSWHSFDGIEDNQLRDGQVADQAITVLQALKENKTKGDNRPFFLAVGFHKPHLPFFAPSKYYDMYPSAEHIKLPANPDAPKDIPPIAWSTSRELREYKNMLHYNLSECYEDAQASIYGDNCKITGNEAQVLRKAYYACVSYTDAQVGKVMKELEAQGFGDNTIVVFWADHGWQLGEHNLWGKFTNLEDGTHVPFMIRVPGITDKGMRTDAIVELIDIFPTLTDLTGLKTPPICPEGDHKILTCVEGVSAAPLLKDPKMEWKKAAFSQYARPQYAGLFKIPNKPSFNKAQHGEDVMGYTIRVNEYRFVEWYKFNRTTGVPDFNNVWGTELYNHTEPVVFFDDENVNMAKDEHMQSVVTELRGMLQKGWRAAMP